MSSRILRRLPVVVTGTDRDTGRMTMNAVALQDASTVTLRILDGGREARDRQLRTTLREIVGGCPDHWWKPTALRTAACTCDR
jgi:hypothetical protein